MLGLYILKKIANGRTLSVLALYTRAILKRFELFWGPFFVAEERPHCSEAAWGPEWRAKVEELSLRGMTFRSLLEFFREDLRRMPGGYKPKVHRTRDVVRQVIIPLTSEEECASRFPSSTLLPFFFLGSLIKAEP